MKRLAWNFPKGPWLEHGVLIAVSGGADSTALLHGLVNEVMDTAGRKSSLAVGHVNHGLRGAASDDDARFVEQLAEQLGLRYFEHRIEPLEWSSDRTGSREAAARNIRYDFFLRTARRLGFRYIAAAHTADDQAETVLHRLLRGTGLSGLAGIARLRQLDDAVTLVRPLLNVRRAEIIEYLNESGRIWRTDETNAGNDFTRNRIRNRLLPELRERFNPKVDDALHRLARLAGDNETVLDELAGELLDRLSRNTKSVTEFDSRRLRRFSEPTIRELFLRTWKNNGWPLRDMGLAEWDRLVEFFLRGEGRREFPDRIEARHEGESFLLKLSHFDPPILR